MKSLSVLANFPNLIKKNFRKPKRTVKTFLFLARFRQRIKKVETVVPTFNNIERTRDILAKSFGISGFQLEKAEAIVEASEKEPIGLNPMNQKG
jgi:hypothetical protein